MSCAGNNEGQYCAWIRVGVLGGEFKGFHHRGHGGPQGKPATHNLICLARYARCQATGAKGEFLHSLQPPDFHVI